MLGRRLRARLLFVGIVLFGVFVNIILLFHKADQLPFFISLNLNISRANHWKNEAACVINCTKADNSKPEPNRIPLSILHSTSSTAISSPIWNQSSFAQNSSVNNITFVDALTSRFFRNTTIILSYIDLPFVDMAVNFYETSLKAHGISQFMFAVSGADCCTKLTEYGVPADACFAYRTDNASSQASSYGSQDFIRKMNIRTDMILDALQAGFTVIHSDIDMIFTRNPLPALEAACPTCDVAALTDDDTFNAGFVYVRPTTLGIKLYTEMQNMSQMGSKLDDQEQMNQVIKKMSKIKLSYRIDAVKLSTGEFLCGKNYFEEAKRVFVGDNPCSNCVVIHNNWIVSEDAKIFRFREHHMWMIDRDEYYSSTTRKYLTFDLPLASKNASKTRSLEQATLVVALAIGQVLNRTVILPKFHCRSGKVVKLCPLNDLVLLETFNSMFANTYREHTFLTNPKVPAVVKQSLSPFYHIDSGHAPPFQTLPTATEGSYDNPSVVRLENADGDGPNSDKILQWFGKVPESVLRFRSLYGAFSRFTSEEENENFLAKVRTAIIPGNYRQYTSKDHRNTVVW